MTATDIAATATHYLILNRIKTRFIPQRSVGRAIS